MTKAQRENINSEIRATLAHNLAALISERTGGEGLAPSLAAQIVANDEARALEFQIAFAPKGGA